MRRPFVPIVFAVLVSVSFMGPAIAQNTPVKLNSGWGAKGMLEPDTALDRADGWMWSGPDQNTSGAMVYFNGFLGICATQRPCLDGSPTYVVSYNPNFASLGTAHQASPSVFMAMLGVWKDCNKDGYVGLGDNALYEYRSVLLPAGHVCNAATTGMNVPFNGDWSTSPFTGTVPHNDGTWVHEFIPIGWKDLGACQPKPGDPINSATCRDDSPWDYNDNAARVWVDYGKPGAFPVRTCTLFALPFMGFHTTGGMLEYADCHLNYRILNTFDSVADMTNVPAIEAMRFNDVPREDTWKSQSTLNRRNPYGWETDDSYYNGWDCNTNVGPAVAVPTQGTFQLHGVKVPSASHVNTGGSLAGTLNETDMWRRPVNNPDAANGNCESRKCHQVDPSGAQCAQGDLGKDGTVGDRIYGKEGIEGPLTNIYEVRKRPDANFPYRDSFRGQGSTPQQTATGKSASNDFGTNVRPEGIWAPRANSQFENRNPYVNRDSLEPAKPLYLTYYAYVTPSVKYSLPRGNAVVGTYGDGACANIGPAGIDQNGWACNPDTWYPNDDEVESNPRDAHHGRDAAGNAGQYGIRVGQPYNLRDVDCYDESATALRPYGVGWGMLSNTNLQPSSQCL